MSTQIKIVRQAMNTDRTHAYGLIFKLQYSFPNSDQPRLEVFLDNEITKSEEWAIYGVKLHSGSESERSDIYRYLEFEELGQSKHFRLGQNFRIEFTGMSKEEVNYRRTGKKFEPAYHFRVGVAR